MTREEGGGEVMYLDLSDFLLIAETVLGAAAETLGLLSERGRTRAGAATSFQHETGVDLLIAMQHPSYVPSALRSVASTDAERRAQIHPQPELGHQPRHADNRVGIGHRGIGVYGNEVQSAHRFMDRYLPG